MSNIFKVYYKYCIDNIPQVFIELQINAKRSIFSNVFRLLDPTVYTVCPKMCITHNSVNVGRSKKEREKIKHI